MLRYDFSKNYPSLFRIFLCSFDIGLVLFSGIMAYYLRFHHFHFGFYYCSLLGLSIPVSLIIFSCLGLYQPFREKRLTRYILNIVFSICLIFSILSVFSVMTKTSIYYSRIWLIYWFFILNILFILSRIIVYAALFYLRNKGLNVKRIIIIGMNERALDLIKKLKNSTFAGVFPVLLFSEKSDYDKKESSIPIYPLSLRHLSKWVRRAYIDEVWIVLSLKNEELIQDISKVLVDTVVSVRYVPDLLGLSFRRHTMTEILGCPLINLYASPMLGERRWIKAIEDRGFALLFLLIAFPIMLILALLIKLTSPGPVFFTQWRHGWRGKKFKVYKFRSMIVHQEKSGVLSQASKEDARVTKIGRILRKTSLDELPQLINVLQGHMSIVGPRPHAIEHNEYYKDLIESYMHRFRMKPGITGWAQVNGYRGETDTLEKMQHRIEHDLYYIENWSVPFDLKIILLTLWRGFFNKNAY